jgi:hypothetical protein
MSISGKIGVLMEPFSLAVLGGVTAAEGIKFLYGQASEILKEWRTRRAKADDNTIVIPLADSAALDHSVAATDVDLDLLGQRHRELITLSAALSPYALGHADIDLSDARLATSVDALRSLIEGLYGVRLTFRGEAREAGGTTLTVEQRLRSVHGSATGIESRRLSGPADVAVSQDVGEIGAGGTVTGAKIDEIG